MKKKELKSEIERLNKVISEQRNEIRTLLSDGNVFKKQMIKAKYITVDDLEKVIWQGCTGDLIGGLPNGFYGMLINTSIQDL